MSHWDRELPNYRDTKRGVREQAERLPNRKKRLERDWFIVRIGLKAGWMYELVSTNADGNERIWIRGVPHVRRHKHWFDPPIMEKISAHRTEEDARRELEKTRWQREGVHRYFICHRSIFERLRPYWAD